MRTTTRGGNAQRLADAHEPTTSAHVRRALDVGHPLQQPLHRGLLRLEGKRGLEALLPVVDQMSTIA